MMDLLHALLPLFTFTFNVVCQISLSRHILGLSLLKGTVLSFFFAMVCLVAIEFIYPQRAGAGYWLMHLITYSALGYCYFHFINLGETARRVRLLRELHDAPEGLSLDEILKRYPASEIIERRIERLVSSKQIVCQSERYLIKNPFMAITARGIVALKWIFLGKSSEFG